VGAVGAAGGVGSGVEGVGVDDGVVAGGVAGVVEISADGVDVLGDPRRGDGHRILAVGMSEHGPGRPHVPGGER